MPPGEDRHAFHWVLDCTVLALLSALALAFSWVGFLASDDVAYVAAAREWLSEGDYLPQSHWSVRHPTVLAISASILLFGDSEFAVIAATLAYYIALALMTYLAVRSLFGREAGLASACLLALTPLFGEIATYPSADVTEVFWSAASVLLFIVAVRCERARPGLLFASGVTAGVALLNRETAVVLPLLFACLMFSKLLEPRYLYAWIVAGALLVIGLELLLFMWHTGDALYRYEVVLGVTGPGGPLPVRGTGNLLDGGILGPLSAVFINNEFALLFIVAVPLALWLVLAREVLAPGQRHALLILLALGVLWFVSVGYLLPLRALPRYFAVSAYVAVVVVGVALVRLRWKSPRVALAVAALLVVSNLASTAVANRNPRLAERTLVSLAASGGEVIYTNPETRLRAQMYLDWAGVDPEQTIRTEPPPPNALYLYVPEQVRGGERAVRQPFPPALYEPEGSWTVQRRAWSRRLPFADLLAAIGVLDLLPSRIVEKLFPAEPTIVVYRTGAS